MRPYSLTQELSLDDCIINFVVRRSFYQAGKRAMPVVPPTTRHFFIRLLDRVEFGNEASWRHQDHLHFFAGYS